MEKNNKIKLNQLNKAKLSKQEMNRLIGESGACCHCGCAYANSGGSSMHDNGYANMLDGLEPILDGGWMIYTGT